MDVGLGLCAHAKSRFKTHCIINLSDAESRDAGTRLRSYRRGIRQAENAAKGAWFFGAIGSGRMRGKACFSMGICVRRHSSEALQQVAQQADAETGAAGFAVGIRFPGMGRPRNIDMRPGRITDEA